MPPSLGQEDAGRMIADRRCDGLPGDDVLPGGWSTDEVNPNVADAADGDLAMNRDGACGWPRRSYDDLSGRFTWLSQPRHPHYKTVSRGGIGAGREEAEGPQLCDDEPEQYHPRRGDLWMNRQQRTRIGLLLLSLAALVFLTGCMICSFPLCSSFGRAWEPVSSSPRAGGIGQAVLGTGDLIYILRAAATGAYQFWVYSPASATWTDLTPPPERPKSGTSMATDGGAYIYALLGAAYSDPNRTFFYRYHIPTDSWTQLSSTAWPQGAGNALTWSGLDSRFYALLGSHSHNPGPGFAAYDPATDTWETLPFNPDWPKVDDGASLAWTGGEWIYGLAGEWHETIPKQDSARYHISTRTWHALPDIPDPEGVGDGASLLWVGQSASHARHCLFALGGNSALEDPGYRFFVFNLGTSTWTELGPLPCPVGSWTGNRLAYAAGALWYWQGAPTTWACGGDKLYRLPLQ